MNLALDANDDPGDAISRKYPDFGRGASARSIAHRSVHVSHSVSICRAITSTAKTVERQLGKVQYMFR